MIDLDKYMNLKAYKMLKLTFVRFSIKSMYPQKVFHSILDEHSKIFVRYTAECEYQLDFRSKDKDKPLGVATINSPTQVRNRNKIRKLEKDGYKFYKIDKLTRKKYNSFRKFNPIFYKNTYQNQCL